MFGSLVRALIYLCFLAIAYYLVIWVLGGIGIAIPPIVLHILGIIFVLVAILVLYQLLWPALRGYDWWGRRPPVVILVALASSMLLSAQASAANCWWTPGGVVVLPGWAWEDGRCISDYERRERHHPRHDWDRDHERWHDRDHWRDERR